MFNAVVNNAFSNALSCFAKASSDQTLVFRVQMTVGNQGAVEEAVQSLHRALFVKTTWLSRRFGSMSIDAPTQHFPGALPLKPRHFSL